MGEKQNWYVSCSPRSPEKIQPELHELIKYELRNWVGVKGRIAQEEFANDLANMDSFRGETHEGEVSFSARDRIAPMKTYGFVYVNKKNQLIITDAGKQLSNNIRPKDVFLKQLIKWQYPSFQHKGSSYPSESWCLHPFRFLLKLAHKINGLTKFEIAMFGLVVKNNNELEAVATEIINFREKTQIIDGLNQRLEFMDNAFYVKYKNIYIDVVTVREGKSEQTNDSAIRTKMRNAIDVADATIRYFRYTNLFSAKGNRLIVSERKINEVYEINNSDTFLTNYNDVEHFYETYGNPTLPKMNYEDIPNLKKNIITILSDNFHLHDTIKKEFNNLEKELNLLNLIKSQVEITDLEQLKDNLYFLRELNIELRKKELQLEYKNPSKIQEIINLLELYYGRHSDLVEQIGTQFIANKNTVLEYLVLMGFIALGSADEYINNFTVDEELQPISHAAGNQSDMEIKYLNFISLCEVTTSKGATQFKMEKEPVTRHYLRRLDELQKKSEKVDLYCLFIAPNLNDATVNEFMKYNLIHDTKIIPITLYQFVHLLKTKQRLLKSKTEITEQDLANLFSTLYKNTLAKDIDKIKFDINETIDKWFIDEFHYA